MSAEAIQSAIPQEDARFKFGENWQKFLLELDDSRIEEAVKSLKENLEVENLDGKTFLDIGSGSGLFSLAARKLGAKVYSFDYDEQSVACALYLRDKYFPDDSDWEVEQGSVLDMRYLQSLGKFDVVYSWGVLHHTGDMRAALENAATRVKDGGQLFISIYNDQGRRSAIWKKVKKLYVTLPEFLRWTVVIPSVVYQWGPTVLIDLFSGKPFHSWKEYGSRGMSPWRDVIDWVGGYPFEVATPDMIFDFYHQRGYQLVKLRTQMRGSGCNEYVFKKVPPA